MHTIIEKEKEISKFRKLQSEAAPADHDETRPATSSRRLSFYVNDNITCSN